MDLSKWTKDIPKWFQKYRYPIIIVLLGILLFTIPEIKNENTQKQVQTATIQQVDTAQQLAQMLSQIEGVGKVKVMLTVAEGEKTLYHSDEDVSSGDTTSSVRQETIIVNDSNRNQQALISQILSPKYQGAVVVCDGAKNPAVKLAIVEAVSKATGLGADQISVLKMK
jgi:stage III sporulation protein AG